MKLLFKILIIFLIIFFIIFLTNINMGAKPCVFCNIKKLSKNLILYEDENILIFKDKSPDAKVHLQCIPKKHIIDKNHLTKNDLNLLNHMYNTASDYIIINYEDLLTNNNKPIFGFHKPPFNSIKHLHMHCIITPYTKCYMKIFNNCILEDFDSVIQDLEQKG